MLFMAEVVSIRQFYHSALTHSVKMHVIRGICILQTQDWLLHVMCIHYAPSALAHSLLFKSPREISMAACASTLLVLIFLLQQ